MAQVKIEVCRSGTWTTRQEGAADVTAEQLTAMLPTYAIQYAHRAFLDGALVAEIPAPKRGRRVA